MTGNVTDAKMFVEYQGDLVLVHRPKSFDLLMTIVHVVDGDGHHLRLCNREASDHRPDWAISQKLWDAIRPNSAEWKEQGVKWWLTIL
jgi:hypothetical protein